VRRRLRLGQGQWPLTALVEPPDARRRAVGEEPEWEAEPLEVEGALKPEPPDLGDLVVQA
jgi:hypothetical protein